MAGKIATQHQKSPKSALVVCVCNSGISVSPWGLFLAMDEQQPLGRCMHTSLTEVCLGLCCCLSAPAQGSSTLPPPTLCTGCFPTGHLPSNPPLSSSSSSPHQAPQQRQPGSSTPLKLRPSLSPRAKVSSWSVWQAGFRHRVSPGPKTAPVSLHTTRHASCSATSLLTPRVRRTRAPTAAQLTMGLERLELHSSSTTCRCLVSAALVS